MKLKINELAVIYYNLEKANRYNIDSTKDKEKARSNFENSTHFDRERLAQAFEIYASEMRKEFEELLETKGTK